MATTRGLKISQPLFYVDKLFIEKISSLLYNHFMEFRANSKNK